MNVTEFAERIVFGTTLEDKLAAPGILTFDPTSKPGFRIDSLRTPGRPPGLSMQTEPGGSQPPSDDLLERESERGKLLHFLANHELLATELMALVLLKFPEAPYAFRQGVLVTLQEEQQHTRMYIERMKACGVELGAYPVSGQFWRVVEPMRSPIDFVSRLSLTFEQANLDYSLHFANVFDRIGDKATAAILHQVYQDEIGHVRHGLHWFRKWKRPELSDWKAYESALDFPMSPQRARGPRAAFNREGRLQAGLTEAFIDALEVYRQSRGRSPMVRWFDPAAEETLSGEMPPRMQRRMDQLGKDLQCVMIPLSREDDVLLVRDLPSRAFQKALVDAGFDLPEITRLDQRDRLNRRKLLGFDPWAWTPDNHQLVEHLHSAVHHTVPTWHEGIRQLFRKSWATRQMAQWLENESSLPDAFGTGASLGRAVHLPSEIPDALAEFANRGYQTALVKRDLGASGRGQRRLRCDRPLTRQDWDWLQSLPAPHNQQPIAVVEPELDRLVDISFLWIMPPDGSTVKYRGWTRPLIAPNRRYAGTHLNRSFSDLGAWGDEGNRLKRWILSDRCKRLDTTAQWLEARLVPLMRELEFQGKFAVDAMVYRRRNGETTEFRIKPLVELNPRTTMGHVALELATHLAPGIQAEFRILNRAQWQPQRDTFLRPPLEKSRDGRWRSGIVLLGEINDTTQLLPVVYIGDALHLAPPP